MNNKPILSIVIPTYNRAVFLEDLLNHIVPQAEESKELVEICISNNCSTDNTREIVASFQKKYPGLINYNENKENLGVDRNLLKIMEMSQGDFIWLLGDDDMIISNGIKKVINFIKDYCNEDTGLINLAHRSYFVDNKTGKEIVYFHTVEKDKSRIYRINREDVVGICFPSSLFLSVLLINNNFLKKTLKEEKQIIEKAMGNYYIHAFLYRIMFLKYPQLEAVRFNEKIIDEELHYYKFYIEDKFRLHYVAWKKLNILLLSSGYVSDRYKEIITDIQKGLTKSFIIEMGMMRGFKAFNCSSSFGCLKMFFQQATPIDALLFSAFFVIFSIIPSVVLRNLYKIFIKIKHKKEWQKFWLYAIITNSETSKGTRRLTF